MSRYIIPPTPTQRPVYNSCCSRQFGRLSCQLHILLFSKCGRTNRSQARYLTLFCEFSLVPFINNNINNPFLSLIITWIFWLAAAASITTDLGGTLDCSTQNYFAYCGQLNAMLALSWLIWYCYLSRRICANLKLDCYSGF